MRWHLSSAPTPCRTPSCASLGRGVGAICADESPASDKKTRVRSLESSDECSAVQRQPPESRGFPLSMTGTTRESLSTSRQQVAYYEWLIGIRSPRVPGRRGVKPASPLPSTSISGDDLERRPRNGGDPALRDGPLQCAVRLNAPPALGRPAEAFVCGDPGGVLRVGTGPVTNAAQRSISTRRWSNRSLRA